MNQRTNSYVLFVHSSAFERDTFQILLLQLIRWTPNLFLKCYDPLERIYNFELLELTLTSSIVT